jgi:hypothetical protein
MYKNDRVTRRYSEPFKLKILTELSIGKYTKSQLGKLYSIAPHHSVLLYYSLVQVGTPDLMTRLLN